MIDLHSHILPKFDDGARDMAESLAIIRQLSGAGFSTVVATPHIRYGDGWEADLQEADRLYQALLADVQAAQISINLELGCELYASEELIYAPDLHKAAIQGTHYVLLELPFFGDPVWLKELLYVFEIQGLRPIIAHPERCEAILHHSPNVNCLYQQNVLFQLNLGSLLNFYGPKVRRQAKKLLKESHYNLIGSDLHRAEPRQYDVEKAGRELERRVTTAEFQQLVSGEPEKIFGER